MDPRTRKSVPPAQLETPLSQVEPIARKRRRSESPQLSSIADEDDNHQKEHDNAQVAINDHLNQSHQAQVPAGAHVLHSVYASHPHAEIPPNAPNGPPGIPVNIDAGQRYTLSQLVEWQSQQRRAHEQLQRRPAYEQQFHSVPPTQRFGQAVPLSRASHPLARPTGLHAQALPPGVHVQAHPQFGQPGAPQTHSQFQQGFVHPLRPAVFHGQPRIRPPHAPPMSSLAGVQRQEGPPPEQLKADTQVPAEEQGPAFKRARSDPGPAEHKSKSDGRVTKTDVLTKVSKVVSLQAQLSGANAELFDACFRLADADK